MDKKKLSSIKGEELETLQEILEKLQKIAKSNGNVLLMRVLKKLILQLKMMKLLTKALMILKMITLIS